MLVAFLKATVIPHLKQHFSLAFCESPVYVGILKKHVKTAGNGKHVSFKQGYLQEYLSFLLLAEFMVVSLISSNKHDVLLLYIQHILTIIPKQSWATLHHEILLLFFL